MSEYIKKEDAIASIQAHDPVPEARGGREWAEYLLEDVMSADVVEVRHSVWRVRSAIPDKEYECMNCKEAVGWKYLYCPNCGAKMDGEKE